MHVKKHGFFRKILVDLPKQVADDIFDRDPSYFRYQGCIIYEGRQGSGKTIAMIHDMNLIQQEYPDCKVLSNIAYTYQDSKLTTWRKLLGFNNGIYGVGVVMDELQNWFSSNDSKNFPPEMLTIITQNRKNRRVIMGTSQNFYLLAKAIRSQCTEIRRCTTILGALTIVRRFEPFLDSEGNVKKYKSRGMYFFVHNKELRDMYNTYEVVERVTNVGFQDRPQETNVSNNISIIEKKGKK